MRVAVLAEEHVDGEHQAGVEHDQRLSRQSPGADRAQLLDAMLRGREMIAVEDLDAITGQQRWQRAAGRRDDRLQRFAVVRTNAAEMFGLDVVELVVDRLERDADRLGAGVIGRVHRGPHAGDDQTHQVDDRGEQERARVLPFGDVLEEFVHRPRREGVLQKAPDHDREGAVLGKPFKDLAEQHEGRLHAKLVTPWMATA